MSAPLSPAEHDALRTMHRPSDPEALRVEALRLLDNGLSPADVSHALRIAESVVRDWMGER